MTEPGPLSDPAVYRMFEGFLLRPERGQPGSVFSRLSFRLPPVGAVRERSPGPREVPSVRIAVADSVPFPSFGEVTGYAVVDDAESGCQHVWFARNAAGAVSLDRLSLTAVAQQDGQAQQDGEALRRTTYPLSATWVRSIAGEAALASSARVILVTGTSAEGVLVGAFDPASGTIAGTWTLPGSKPGDLIGSWVLAQDFGQWLFATVRTKTGTLATIAVDARSLTPGEPVPAGDARPLPEVPAAAQSRVNTTLGSMLSASASQQLIMTATDPAGSPFVVLQGFDAGKPALVARAPIDTGFAKPRTAEYRVTCADLDNNGKQELVVAYPTDYGGVSGAAAFVLFRYDAEQKKLESTSEYIAAAPSKTPLASKDLRLGSGILGDAVTSGVLVLGAGGDFAHVSKGEVQIFAGVLPVNPATLRFPPYTEVPDTLPNVTQVADTGVTAPGIIGSVADLFGLSVTLGQPSLTQLSSRGQLLAMLQVVPFDRDVVDYYPSLSFSQSDNEVKGLSVSSSKDWMMSVDAGLSLGIDTSSLYFGAGNSYGRGFAKTEDSTTTTGVSISRMPVQLDRLVTVGVSYSVWQYPILRRSRGQQPGGTMLVVFPTSAIPQQETPVAYGGQFGYRTSYEPGQLLTYLNVDLDGWDETRQGELLLFRPLVSLEVTNDLPDTNTYDRTDANQSTIGKSFFLASTTYTSASLLKATRLFSFLPASFGFNLSTSETFADNEMETTSLARTESLSISVSGGTVRDASLRYTVTPYIYQHAGLGCTVVAFKVSNLGPGWKRRYSDAYPMLIIPFRHLSEDKLERTHSRSISFEPQDNGTVHVVVEVFNRGYIDAEIVTVELYRGTPKFDGQDPVIPPAEDRIGKVTGRVVALGRQRLRVPWTPKAKPEAVTVVVWGGDRLIEEAEIAWNIYPESSYLTLGLPGTDA